MKQMKKVLAMCLCFAMCLSLFPAWAFAEGENAEAATVPVIEVEEPVYEEPVYEEPVYEEPVYEEPVYEEPVYEEPVYEEPVYEEPVYEEPVYEEPVFEETENGETELSATEGTETETPVRVYFDIPTEKTAVRVYTKDEYLNETDIEPEEDGSFQLIPGQYYYAIQAEGFEMVEETAFTVVASNEALTLSVELRVALAGEGTDADSKVAALTIAQILTGEGISFFMPEDTAADDNLLTEYAAQQLEQAKPSKGDMLKAPTRPTSGLNAAQAEVYNILKGYITETAAGQRPNTQYTVTFDNDFIAANLTWTPETLPGGGYTSFTSENWAAAAEQGYEATMRLGPIHTALLNTLPYELYWYDKTMGVLCNYSFNATQMSDGSIANVYISSITYIFSVAQAYSDEMTYATDSSGTVIRNPNNGRAYPICVRNVGSTITEAVANAQAVVSSFSGLTDLGKLTEYKNYICSQVSYNHNAVANDYDLGYGDPWQLIYAFDNDYSTNIVCEGYSKAFEYLCDLSTFSDSNVHAYCVTGTMDGGTGAGAHMWNIVSLDDGRNYLVDVTNCDEGSVGSPDELFLKGCTSGNPDEGYTFSCNDGYSEIAYVYDSETRGYYNTEELTVSAYDYGTNAPSALEQLRTAIANGESSYNFGDTTTLIISENLTIPGNMRVEAPNVVLTVLAGKTLTVDGTLFMPGGQNGVVIEEGGSLEIGESGKVELHGSPDLTAVSGSMTVGGKLYLSRGHWGNLNDAGSLTNITTVGENAEIRVEMLVQPEDQANLDSRLGIMEDTAIPDHLVSATRLEFTIAFPWTLEHDYDIPAGINIHIQNNGTNETGSVMVPAGNTLTVNGYFALRGAGMTVNGTMVNNGTIHLHAGDQTGAASALTLSETAAYQGTGEVRVYYDDVVNEVIDNTGKLTQISDDGSVMVYRVADQHNNTSFETAIELTGMDRFELGENSFDQVFYYIFVPTSSAEYTLRSETNQLTEIILYDVNGNQLQTSATTDNGSIYYGTFLTASLVENTVYYYSVHPLDGGTHPMCFTRENYLRANAVEENVRISKGEGATLQVAIEGKELDGVTYRWTSYSDIDGWRELEETTDTLITEPIQTATQYQCNVTDKYGNNSSVWFYVSVDNHFNAVAEQASPIAVSYNDTATLRVMTYGDDLDGVIYRWTSYSDIDGWCELEETTDTLITEPIQTAINYNCQVTDKYGNEAYVGFTVQVDNGLSVTAVGLDTTPYGTVYLNLPLNESFTVTAEVSAYDLEGISYLWKKQGWSGENTTLAETGNSITDTVTDRSYYYLTVTDRYQNQVFLTFVIDVDNSLRAWVDGDEGRTSATLYLSPGETAVMKATVSAIDADRLTYRWFYDIHYKDGSTVVDSMSGSAELTSIAMAENIDYVHYMFQVQDKYNNYASVDFWLKLFTYNCGAEGDNVTWSFDESTGVLTVSGTGAMADSMGAWEMYKDQITAIVVTDGVTGIGAETFSSLTGITSITLPQGLEQIGRNAFSNTNISSITIPNSVTTVEYGAFENCIYLTELTLPENLETIGAYAFSGTSLTELTLPEGVRSIAYSGFEGCTSLTTVSLPESLEEIGELAFADNTSLTEVTLPNSVRSIAYSIFEGCTSLSEVNLPDHLEEIGERAFAENTSLTEITIPITTTQIMPHAFAGCTNLRTVYYAGTQAQWDAIEIGEDNDPLINANKILQGENITWSLNRETGELTVSATGPMPDYSYSNFVDEFGTPHFTTTAPWGAKEYYFDIRRIIIEEGVTNIGAYAFCDMENVESVSLPETLEVIGAQAFAGLHLIEITIPTSVTNIGYNAFIYKDNETSPLQNVYYNGTQEEWNAIMIGAGNDALIEHLVIAQPETETSRLKTAIENNDPFFDLSNKGTVVLDETLTIPSGMRVDFRNTELVVPENVTLEVQGQLDGSVLTVNGDVIVNGVENNVLRVDTNLAFGRNGEGSLRIQNPNAFIELDGGNATKNYTNYFSNLVPHIELGADVSEVILGYSVSSQSDMESIIVNIQTEGILSDSRYRHDLQLQAPVALSGEMTIPAHITLHTDCVWNSAAFTVANGAVLTIDDGSLLFAFSSDIIIEGTLVNNGEIHLGIQTDTGTVSRLILSNGGNYSGTGEILVEATDDAVSYLPGFNENDLQMRWSNSDAGVTCYIYTVGVFDALKNAAENGAEYFALQDVTTLTISKDLEIPAGMLVDAWNTVITVPAGRILLVNGSINMKGIVIEDGGTVRFGDGANADIRESIVRGDTAVLDLGHNVNFNISVMAWNRMSSHEGIGYADESSRIWLNSDAHNDEELQNAVEGMSHVSLPSGNEGQFGKNIFIQYHWVPADGFTVDEGINFHIFCNDYVQSSLTVEAGKAFTVNGYLGLHGAEMTVNGTLINNNCIELLAQDQNGAASSLSLNTGAAYQGSGEILVIKDDSANTLTDNTGTLISSDRDYATVYFGAPVCNGYADGPMGGGIHRFVVNVSNAQLVQFYVRDGAGHEKWYNTTDLSGDYICDVALADFAYSTGTYSAGVYVYDLAGTARYLRDYQFTVSEDEIPAPVCNGTADGPMGDGVHRFVVNVSNAKLVQFYVQDGAGHEKWYNTTDLNGDYICDVALADFAYSIGTYTAGVYVYDLVGRAQYLRDYQFTVTADEVPAPVSGSCTDEALENGIHRFAVEVSNVQLVQLLIQDEAGHQKWYSTEYADGMYICDVALADFGYSVGTYRAGVYVYDLVGAVQHLEDYSFTVTADEVPTPVCNGYADGTMGNGVHRFVVNVSNAQLVQFYIQDGAGHEKWYNTKDVNGDYICDVVLADFAYSIGTYTAGVYVYDLVGRAQYLRDYQFTVSADEVPAPVCNGYADGAMGNGVHRFVVNVSNAQLVQFYVQDGAGHEKWYNTTDLNGDYICDVALADFGYSTGTYNAGVYVYDLVGTARYLRDYQFTVAADEIPVPVCNGYADGPMGGGIHRFVVNVSNAQLVQFYVRDGAGHEKWYNTTDVNGDYICDVLLADFGNTVGTFSAGVYVYDLVGTARYLRDYQFTVSANEVNG